MVILKNYKFNNSYKSYEVMEAEDGKLGYEIIKKIQNFDLIIVNHSMPNMGGIELLEDLEK